MRSLLNSFLECCWPTRQSYDPLPDFEPAQLSQTSAPPQSASPEGSLPTIVPPGQYRAEPGLTRSGTYDPSQKNWAVLLKFGSYEEGVEKESFDIDLNTGWFAVLDITTTDIVGLMQEGLYVTQEILQVQDNKLQWKFWPAHQVTYFYRQFTLIHPKWSGELTVRTANVAVAKEFRLEHLSADRVHLAHANAMTGVENNVYWYDPLLPVAVNFILDDEPLPGLWPWPKKQLYGEGKIEGGCSVIEK